MVFNQKTNGPDTKGSEKAQKHMANIRPRTKQADLRQICNRSV